MKTVHELTEYGENVNRNYNMPVRIRIIGKENFGIEVQKQILMQIFEVRNAGVA